MGLGPDPRQLVSQTRFQTIPYYCNSSTGAFEPKGSSVSPGVSGESALVHQERSGVQSLFLYGVGHLGNIFTPSRLIQCERGLVWVSAWDTVWFISK